MALGDRCKTFAVFKNGRTWYQTLVMECSEKISSLCHRQEPALFRTATRR